MPLQITKPCNVQRYSPLPAWVGCPAMILQPSTCTPHPMYAAARELAERSVAAEIQSDTYLRRLLAPSMN